MRESRFDHSDYCHCGDYKPDICPPECFRAQLTKDLREMDPPYPYPVSYSNFRKSGHCLLEGGEQEDG